MQITGLFHVAIKTNDLDATVKFYTDVLGMTLAHRPDFGFPGAWIAGPDGTPWHSWRVLILPFLEPREVYEAYRFDEPWNGPHNRTLVNKVGSLFRRSGLEDSPAGVTSFVAVVGPGTAWSDGPVPARREAIGDPKGSTILVVEVPDASETPWMAPVDLDFARMSLKLNDGTGRSLGSEFKGARVLTADFSVHNLRDDTRPEHLRALITSNGGEPITWEDVTPPRP